jgi:hypothetical protein
MARALGIGNASNAEQLSEKEWIMMTNIFSLTREIPASTIILAQSSHLMLIRWRTLR